MIKGRLLLFCNVFFLSIFQLLTTPPAHADKVTGSGPEVYWSAPEEGAILDVAAGTEKQISLSSARTLPARGWLLATLRPGEIAWVHIDGDREGKAVRFAFVGGNADGTAAIDVTPERHGDGDFVLTAPAAAGPLNRLALSVRPDQKPPRAQIWIGSVKSPGFRWELWEDLVRRWAKNPNTPPPSPPDLSSEPLTERLAMIQDALAIAQTESGRGDAGAVSALLQAEALMGNLPQREPAFPYFRRDELTKDLAKSRKVQKIEDQKMMELADAQPLTFTLQGPSFLRIEARTIFDKTSPHRNPPLRMVLRGDGRTVGLAVEEMLPVDPTEPGPDALPRSTRRRILISTAPGRHTYELSTLGGPAWVSVITHKRSMHAEQLATHAEDVSRLLDRARSVSRDEETRSVFGQILDGESAYLALDDARARDRYAAIFDNAKSPRLRAFALLRLSALATADANHHAANESTLASALMLLENAPDPATTRLRNLLVAEHLTRVVAELGPGEPPSQAVIALLLQHRQALAYMPAYAGPLLRYIPGPRALSLPLLASAQTNSPLDETLRHFLSREWYTGTRWAALPALEMAGAQLVDLLAPPARLTTCEEATHQGAIAYAPLSEKDAVLEVPAALAPSSSLHRFHLVSLHAGEPRLGWATVTLDGQQSRLPLLLQREVLPFALGAGRHTLRATLSQDKVGSLLGPCALLQQPSNIALLMEHRFSGLNGRGAHARMELPGSGTPGYLGIELRPSATLRGGRLLLRTDQGIIGHIDIEGHGVDNRVVGMRIGPAIMLVVELPAAARALDVIREDNGEQLLVRALLRRSLAKPSRIVPNLPVLEHDNPALLEQLRQATRARRDAKDSTAQARAQLRRAELLSSLGANALSRLDAERALPKLADSSAEERTRLLLTTLNEPSLVLPKPGGPNAAMLAAGANVRATDEEEQCVNRGLARFAKNALQGRAALESCSGALGRYAAARASELNGELELAAQNYAVAFRASMTKGEPRPALAREAALRYAERGPGPSSQDALALATTAVQLDDPDGARAVLRVRNLTHTRVVRGVDEGEVLRADEGAITPLSLRAALVDVPWQVGSYLEVRAGKSSETSFEAKEPLRLRLDLLCDDSGEPQSQAITPPCELRVEIDGTVVNDSRMQKLRGGERMRSNDIALERGVHRIQVSMARRHPVPGPSDGAIVFLHLATNRPLHGASSRSDGDGYYTVPIAPPPVQRFIATPDQAVQLRVQGPTVLRLDAVARGGDKRQLVLEDSSDGNATARNVYPICTQAAELKPQNLQPVQPGQPVQTGFDCRSVVMVPLINPGTHRITVRAAGTPTVALAMQIYEDEPTQPGDSTRPPPPPIAEVQSAQPKEDNAALRYLRRPDSNWLRGLGTLQIQQVGVIHLGGDGNSASDDKYAETAMIYRRKLDDAPVWFKGAAFLHLREGPTSFGLQGRVFARIPVVQLRLSADLLGFTQNVDGNQEYSVGFHSYMERSFEVLPHFYILPRFAFTAAYQSLQAGPALPTESGVAQDGTAVSSNAAAVDASIYNRYDAAHRTAIYGQAILWWVPFINMVVYGSVRLTSNQNVHQLDSVRGRAGFDLAIHTTEFVAYYDIAKYLEDDARNRAVLQHRIGLELGQTVWLNRNHRIGVLFSGNVEAVSRETTVIFGAFWEGSRGRGLDDYSTPEINLPQQLGQGRGSLHPEETLR